MDIDNLVNDILTKRHEPAPNEDPELKAYIENIFKKYHANYITDKLYQTAINPNFKYWIDKSSEDFDMYKLIWIPKYEKFSGIYEICKKTIINKLSYITDVYNFDLNKIKNNKITPLEWMAAELSKRHTSYEHTFSFNVRELFYRYRKCKNDSTYIMFCKTCVAALDASMKLFKDDEYVKIKI